MEKTLNIKITNLATGEVEFNEDANTLIGAICDNEGNSTSLCHISGNGKSILGALHGVDEVKKAIAQEKELKKFIVINKLKKFIEEKDIDLEDLADEVNEDEQA